tara:strand:- start:25951 stop:26286 length:336 start_codon:yes stop_codon:yes gene_type:complete
MRALKAIVIGMGALIVLAIVMLVFGLYKKSVDPTWRLFGTTTAPAPAIAPADPEPGSFETLTLGLKAGCRITDVSADGRRAFLSIGPDAPCAEVIVIDVEDGRVLGRIQPN